LIGLIGLEQEYWNVRVAQDPFLGTYAGVGPYTTLPDMSIEAHQKFVEQYRDLEDRANKLASPHLSAQDKMSLDVCCVWYRVRCMHRVRSSMSCLIDAKDRIENDNRRSQTLGLLVANLHYDRTAGAIGRDGMHRRHTPDLLNPTQPTQSRVT
jgi:hypothetical protein